MKKTILTILISLLFLVGFSQNSGITVQGGYSWLNGIVGAEIQFVNLGISFGYMPTSMPLSGDKVASYSAALTWYGKPYDQDCFYGSFGVASAGYTYEDNMGGSIVKQMTIGMLGYRFTSDLGLSSKIGVGYGWCDLAETYTWEWTLGYTFPLSK
jgi:hypothetical protein